MINAEALERKLRERANYRREQLSDDVVAKCLEEVANALRESKADEAAATNHVEPPEPWPRH